MSTPGPLREAIIRAMTAEAESRVVWELPPELWRINLPVIPGPPVLSRIPVPEGLWALARPPQVLAEIARAASAARYYPGQQEDNEEYGSAYGFAFLHEGWAIVSDSTCSSRERDAADAAAHRLHTRPDKVEVRLFSAVDREQTRYAVMRSRGGTMDEVLVGSADDLGDGPGGAVIDALTRLVKGLTA